MFNYDWAYRAAVPIKTFNQGYERGSPVYATFSFLKLLEKLNICARPQAESAWSYLIESSVLTCSSTMTMIDRTDRIHTQS